MPIEATPLSLLDFVQTDVEVLAETSSSDKLKAPHPSVWITEHPKARIVCIALGHDERTHDHAAFKTILANAVKWASRKWSQEGLEREYD